MHFYLNDYSYIGIVIDIIQYPTLVVGSYKEPMWTLSGLDWPMCHCATEQQLIIVPWYDGAMASPSLDRII